MSKYLEISYVYERSNQRGKKNMKEEEEHWCLSVTRSIPLHDANECKECMEPEVPQVSSFKSLEVCSSTPKYCMPHNYRLPIWA